MIIMILYQTLLSIHLLRIKLNKLKKHYKNILDEHDIKYTKSVSVRGRTSILSSLDLLDPKVFAPMIVDKDSNGSDEDEEY
jgi:hypothetical protein